MIFCLLVSYICILIGLAAFVLLLKVLFCVFFVVLLLIVFCVLMVLLFFCFDAFVKLMCYQQVHCCTHEHYEHQGESIENNACRSNARVSH